MTDKLDRTLALRVADADIERLDALAESIPVATARAIARVAMRIGLDAIERDPALLVRSSIPSRGGARRRKPKPARPNRRNERAPE